MLSQGAMRRLFVDDRKAVSAAHKAALTSGMGDSLLSWTFMQLGIYLEEGHSAFFNGENPVASKIRHDRFCWPILTFHSLRSPSETLEVDRIFRKNPDPSLWLDVWRLYGGLPFDYFDTTPHRENWDHVGRLDESTATIFGVEQAGDCSKLCEKHYKTCIAWTWERERHLCHESPWMIVGEEAEGKTTGLNLPRVKKLAQKCSGLYRTDRDASRSAQHLHNNTPAIG